MLARHVFKPLLKFFDDPSILDHKNCIQFAYLIIRYLIKDKSKILSEIVYNLFFSYINNYCP